MHSMLLTDGLDHLTISEHIFWLCLTTLTNVALYGFLGYFIYSIVNLLIKTAVDWYTIATFVILSFGITIRSLSLTVEDTMSLLYAIANGSDS